MTLQVVGAGWGRTGTLSTKLALERLGMPLDGILVVDGVFALRPELAHHWDLRIWVDIDADLSLCRGTTRDAARDGEPRAATLHRERYGPAVLVSQPRMPQCVKPRSP